MIALTLYHLPPQFDIMNNGTIRIFYYTEQYIDTTEHQNPETGEIKTEECVAWRCNVVKSNDKYLTTLIRENPESIECQKQLLRERIAAYDNSVYVNSFVIDDTNTWIDKATRVGLKLRFEAEKRLGKTETVLWQNGIQFSLPLEGDITALDMLDGIELYASACYDATQLHLSNVDNLKTVDDIKNYNYMIGYPPRLKFKSKNSDSQ